VTVSLLPPIPRPPHDPTSLLCDARVGWPVLAAEHVSSAGGLLSLDRTPAGSRSLVEPSGSFGGLRTPANVTLAAGDVWLLDQASGQLLRFDPCRCGFDPVPCFAGAGAGPRQLSGPQAIAVHAGRLFVSDTSNQRVAVFALSTLALAGHWRAPMDWQPTGIAVDGSGTVHVADPRNGMIHRFTLRGGYLGHWDGFGASTHLAIDCDGVVYAAGAVDAYRVGTGNAAVLLTDSPDEVAAAFPPLPFSVDAEGRLHLGPLCAPPSAVAFDSHGEPVEVGADPAASHERSGTVTLGPFDSRIDSCPWHRLILRGDLGAAGRVELATFTAAIELPADQLGDLPESAWQTRLRCASLAADGAWDGLIRSLAGRYLWLRLDLFGNGRSTPRLDSVEIEFPRVSLRRYLPAVYGTEPRSADFTDRFLALFDRELRDVERTLDELAALFDPLSTPALGWLASWVGMTPPRQQPLARQRELVKQWIRTAALRGTRFGLWQVLVSYLGMDVLTPARPVPAGNRRPPARRPRRTGGRGSRRR
jgi:phage tail-like protein